MRCGKPEHQQGEKCAAKNVKCKECHKIGHFYKVCQYKKRDRKEANLAQATLQAEQDTYIDENGVRQLNPPMVNMLKIINHIGTTSGSQGNHLRFPIDVNPRGPYKDHLVVRVDTGADVNCMNEKTFRRLFPKVKLSVCTHEIQNFGNSILGQFHRSIPVLPVNTIAYDCRQNRGKSNRAKQPNGRNGAQNKSRVQISSSTAQPSRKPPGMEGKCMRCGKPEHQQGDKWAAKNAKCKECHKIGHFYKVCQSKKKTTRANLAQTAPQAEQDTYYNPQAKQDTYIDENGIRQHNPPMVNMYP